MVANMVIILLLIRIHLKVSYACQLPRTAVSSLEFRVLGYRQSSNVQENTLRQS
jgi:hypothetical protein